MRVRATGAVVMGLLAMLVLGSCGDGDGAQGPRLSEQELANQANAICARHTQTIEAAARSKFASRDVPTPQQTEEFAKETIIPEVERQLDELEKLRPEENDEQEFETYIKESRNALSNKVKADPSLVLSEEVNQDPFRQANEEAGELGMTECQNASQRWSRAVVPAGQRRTTP